VILRSAEVTTSIARAEYWAVFAAPSSTKQNGLYSPSLARSKNASNESVADEEHLKLGQAIRRPEENLSLDFGRTELSARTERAAG
jgi:hypothetical protein